MNNFQRLLAIGCVLSGSLPGSLGCVVGDETEPDQEDEGDEVLEIEATTNFLDNPSFSTQISAVKTSSNWYTSRPQRVASSYGAAHSPNAGLFLSACSNACRAEQGVAAKPFATYRLKAWTKTPYNNAYPSIEIDWLTFNGTVIYTDATLGYRSTSWYQLVLTAKAPSNAQGARVRLTSKSSDGTIYFDDVSFAPY